MALKANSNVHCGLALFKSAMQGIWQVTQTVVELGNGYKDDAVWLVAELYWLEESVLVPAV